MEPTNPTDAETRALAILARIEMLDHSIADSYADALEQSLEAAEGRDKLRLMLRLRYFGDNRSEMVDAMAEEAKRQDDRTYMAIARAFELYRSFRQANSSEAIAALEAELADAAARLDWLAETQIRRLLTYAYWSTDRRAVAVETLREAFDEIPEDSPDADFVRMVLLGTMRFVNADAGDLDSLIETSEQLLEIREREGTPVGSTEIVRNFGYLFRLRADYDIALRFYQYYERLLRIIGLEERRYNALWGLARTAQQMNEYRLSFEYAQEALASFKGSPAFNGPLQIMQSINAARMGDPQEARRHYDEGVQLLSMGSQEALQAWKRTILQAEAEIARAEGRLEEAMSKMNAYVEQAVAAAREESSRDVNALRAELAAELGRERAERQLIEREKEMSERTVRAQAFSLGLLAVMLMIASAAFIQQRRSARLVEESRRRAEEANEAKSRFLANMSHELRTPLNAVIGFSDILTRKADDALSAPRIEEYAGMINKSGRHLLDIISDVLDVAQIDATGVDLARQECDLAELVDDAMRMVDTQGTLLGGRLDNHVPEDLPALSIDRRRMTQVVINLLNNSVKFSDPNGHIAVSAWKSKDGGIAFSVSDSGAGIPPDKIDKVMEPFVQADESYSRKYEGAGLGLAIVRSVVEAHGGRVQIESQLKVGTKVTVSLPRRCLAGDADEPAPQSEGAGKVAVA